MFLLLMVHAVMASQLHAVMWGLAQRDASGQVAHTRPQTACPASISSSRRLHSPGGCGGGVLWSEGTPWAQRRGVANGWLALQRGFKKSAHAGQTGPRRLIKRQGRCPYSSRPHLSSTIMSAKEGRSN